MSTRNEMQFGTGGMRVDSALSHFDALFDDTEETSPTILPEDLAELERALLTNDGISPVSSEAAHDMREALDLPGVDEAEEEPVAAPVVTRRSSHSDRGQPPVVLRTADDAGPVVMDFSQVVVFASAAVCAAALVLCMMSLWGWAARVM